MTAFCEQKRAREIDCKWLASRIENFTDEQLKILQILCAKEDFTIKTILDFAPPVKKFGTRRILMIRAFVDLANVTPGALNQFFYTNTFMGDPREMGHEAYQNALREKMIRQDQIDVFYNVCTKVEGMIPRTANAIIPKIRQLKPQHTRVINALLAKDSCFGDKPINNGTLPGFLNLVSIMPEVENDIRFNRFMKRMSRNKKKNKDFLFIIQSLKSELEAERKKTLGNIVYSIRSYLDI